MGGVNAWLGGLSQPELIPTVFGADAHGPEQDPISGLGRHHPPNALPQQQQRLVLPLIFRSHKGAPQLDGRRQTGKEIGLHSKQARGIEASGAADGQNFVGARAIASAP